MTNFEIYGLLFCWFVFSVFVSFNLYSFSCAPYTNFQGSSFEHDVVVRVLIWGNHHRNPTMLAVVRDLGLRKSPQESGLPCLNFIPELPSEWTSSPFTKNFRYSFIYDKRKHSLPSLFIDTEAWIMASRNCETLSVHSCYVCAFVFFRRFIRNSPSNCEWAFPDQSMVPRHEGSSLEY